MSSDYMTDDRRAMLDAYLADKLKRRAGTQNSGLRDEETEGFARKKGTYDAGAFLSGLSEAASMAGTLNGKRSESTIVPDFNKALYNSSQGLTDNMRHQRQDEENAIGTDLRLADSAMRYDEQDDRRKRLDDELKRKAAQRKLAPNIQGPNGEVVVGDDEGNFESRPGFSYRETTQRQQSQREPAQRAPAAPSYQRSDVLGPDDMPLNFNPKTGQYSQAGAPAGSKMKPKAPAGGPNTGKVTDAQRSAGMFYQNAESALKILEEMEAKGYRPGKMTAAKDLLVPDALGGYVYNEDEQRYMQAAEDWTAAKLRLESGASIPRDEVKSQARIYMAAPGSSEGKLKQQQASRRQAMAGLKLKAAGALPGGTSAPTGRIKVSNGKEELEIDEADLQDAQAEGYEVVE